MKKGSGKLIWITIGVMAALAIAFFATRLINLTSIPIFTDEAIYLRWAQIGMWDAKWRFISLTDGKQPLLVWLFIITFKLIKGDPLFLGRLVSVFCGFAAMAGIAAFSWYKTRTIKGMVLGALLYILIPFILFYDRIALYEGLFNAISAWTLFMLYLFARKQRLDTALILGTMIGFGLLTKSYSNFFLLLLPSTLILLKWPKSGRIRVFLKWIGLSLVVFLQSQIYENILRLSEFRHIISEKNLQFIYSFSEFINHPTLRIWGNFVGLGSWLADYLTLPFLVLIITGLIWKIRRDVREGIFFAAWFVVPFLTLAFFGKVIYPRFLLFMLIPLLVPTAEFLLFLLNQTKYRLWVISGLAIVFLNLIYFDGQILFTPLSAPIPEADKGQFLNDWPSGYGIKEVVSFLIGESQKGPLVIGTEGTFGLFPHALELYLGENRNVTTKAYWPLEEFPEELRDDAQKVPTYLVFKERQTVPPDWPIVLIAKYRRGTSDSYLRFFRVTPGP